VCKKVFVLETNDRCPDCATKFGSTNSGMNKTLILKYTAYVEVKLPNEIADKMESGELELYDRWGVVTYTDASGNDVEVEGKPQDVDYKRSVGHYFEDNQEERRMLEWNKMLAERKKAREAAFNKIAHDTKDAIRDPQDTSYRSIQGH